MKIRYITVSAVTLIGFFLLSLLNAGWKFTPMGWLDPHIFLNYFVPELNGEIFDEYYKVSRIPWIAFGRFFYLIFGFDSFIYYLPYILMICYALVYLFFFKYFHLQIYTLGLAFILLTPFFHGAYSGGWTYQNPLINILILFVYLLTFSINTKNTNQRNLFLSHIFLVSLIATNIFVLNFLDLILVFPSLIFIFIKAYKQRILLLSIITFTVGTIFTFTFLAIGSHMLGYNYSFWTPMIEFYFWLNGPDQNHLIWFSPISSGWWRSAYYLLIPLSVSILSLYHLICLVKLFKREGNLRFFNIYDFYSINHLLLTVFLLLSYFLGHIHKILFSYMVQPFYISSVFAIMCLGQIFSRPIFKSSSQLFTYLYPLIIVFIMLYFNQKYIFSNINIIFVLIIVSFLLICVVIYLPRNLPLSILTVIPIFLFATPNFNDQYRENSCMVQEYMSRDFYNIVNLSLNLNGPGLILFNGDSAYIYSDNCNSRIRNMADSLNYIGAYTYGLRDLDTVSQIDLENELSKIPHRSILVLGDFEKISLSPGVKSYLNSNFKLHKSYLSEYMSAQIMVRIS
jgi:hypothetical protein